MKRINPTTIKHHVMPDLYRWLLLNAVKKYILECLGFLKLILGLCPSKAYLSEFN